MLPGTKRLTAEGQAHGWNFTLAILLSGDEARGGDLVLDHHDGSFVAAEVVAGAAGEGARIEFEVRHVAGARAPSDSRATLSGTISESRLEGRLHFHD